jgi:FixJ family two-component response regulator
MASRALFIAIVDDEAEVGKALKRLLRSLGHAVETFTSGVEFLRWLPGRMPDCVLLDIQMPVMTGFEVHQRLAAEHLALTCIFITASTDAADLHRATEAGCAVMRKPLGEEQLIAAIHRATDRG